MNLRRLLKSHLWPYRRLLLLVVVLQAVQTFATLTAGDFFGEIAIIGGGRRSATVTTTTPARLLVMFGTEFRQLQKTHPGIAAQLETAMATRSGAG